MRQKGENGGYSLVELIVVIAIMAVLLGITTYSATLISGKEAKRCANNISTALDKTKSYSLVKSGTADVYLLIKKDASERLVAEYYFPEKPLSSEYKLHSSELLGKKSCEVGCRVNGHDFSIEGDTELRIFYNRITGAFKDAVVMSGGSEAERGICSAITVKRGKTYQLDLISATGKHTIQAIN